MASYQQIYERLYFPFFESKVKRRNTASLYFDAVRSQWLSRDQLMADQLIKLKALLLHAQDHCPYYSGLFREHGFHPEEITTAADLQRLPLLNKEKIRANYDSLLSTKHRQTLWQKSTGGSTGEPLHFAYTKQSYEWRVAMSKRGYAWAGALPGSKQAYIWGDALGSVSHLKKIKENLHHFVDRQMYFNSFDFDEKAMRRCAESLNAFQPSVLIGYTNPLYNLARFIGDRGKVRVNLKGIICAAETVHPFQREIIERVFGAKAFNTYGSREFMLIASECEEHQGLHINSENLVVEVIREDGSPAGDGETGKIVITDLHNFGMPFIRYEIGDLGVATSRSCACGRGLPLLLDVVGRSLDMIRTPEGKVVPGEFFPHLMKDFPAVARFQVVQERLDTLVVTVVPGPGFGFETSERINSEIRKVIGATVKVEYRVVASIPLTATGKYRVAVSHVK
jgi:phenylacetate-CoA ligase